MMLLIRTLNHLSHLAMYFDFVSGMKSVCKHAWLYGEATLRKCRLYVDHRGSELWTQYVGDRKLLA